MSDRRPSTYSVSRDIWDHPVFKAEPFTEREAWQWLIGAAAWKAIRYRGKTGPVLLERAEFCFALSFLAKRWDWSESHVDRFVKKLLKNEMIVRRDRNGSAIYFIKNYNRFQFGQEKPETISDGDRNEVETPPERERDKEETLKQDNRITEEEGAPAKAAAVASKPDLFKAIGLRYPIWLPTEPWAAFIDMRRQKDRKGFTANAERLLLRRLEQLANQGHDPTGVIEQSTMNGWKGFFPIKQDSANGHRKTTAHDRHNQGTALYIASLGLDPDGPGEGGASGDAGQARLPLLAS